MSVFIAIALNSIGNFRNTRSDDSGTYTISSKGWGNNNMTLGVGNNSLIAKENFMAKFKIFLILILGVLLITTVSHAGTRCSGTLANVGISYRGDVHVSLRNVFNWIKICSIETEVAESSLAPDSCKLLYNQLVQAQVNERDVSLWFRGSLNCSSFRDWQWAPAPLYFAATQ